jgi:hypothetical protein
MRVTVVGIDDSAGAREALLFVDAARDARHDDVVVLTEVLRRGRRS